MTGPEKAKTPSRLTEKTFYAHDALAKVRTASRMLEKDAADPEKGEMYVRTHGGPELSAIVVGTAFRLGASPFEIIEAIHMGAQEAREIPSA